MLPVFNGQLDFPDSCDIAFRALEPSPDYEVICG